MITIFTPTFNRGDKLKKLYESLLKQNDKNFIWMIVDDGSFDNTKELVDVWKKEINIEYIYQQNAGKHIAMNNAFNQCKTRYMMCVDSDDTLKSNAVYIINNVLLKQFEKNIWGIVGPRIHTNGKLTSKWRMKNFTKCKFAELYGKYKYKGDTYILMNIDFLRNFEFVKIYNEKIVPESVLYDYLDINYYIKTSDELIYISEYYDDGYTKNSSRFLFNSPCGIALANISAANNQYNSFIKRVLAFSRYRVVKKIFSNNYKLEYYNNYNIRLIVKIISVFVYPLMYIHYWQRRL